MATFRKPNMSKINSQLNKIKSTSRQFERDANRTISELKNVERKAKAYQNKLRSSAIPALTTMPSLYLGYSINNGKVNFYSIMILMTKSTMSLFRMHQKIKMRLLDHLQRHSGTMGYQYGTMSSN